MSHPFALRTRLYDEVMSDEKHISLTDDLVADLCLKVERQVVETLKRRIAWECKKVDSNINGLAFALENYLEHMKSEIVQVIREHERSIDF